MSKRQLNEQQKTFMTMAVESRPVTALIAHERSQQIFDAGQLTKSYSRAFMKHASSASHMVIFLGHNHVLGGNIRYCR